MKKGDALCRLPVGILREELCSAMDCREPIATKGVDNSVYNAAGEDMREADRTVLEIMKNN